MNWQQQPPGAQGAPGEFGQAQGAAPAGWYPDSADPGVLRYWDGTQWTEHTAPSQAATETTPAYRQDAAPSPGYGQHSAPPGYGQAATPGAGGPEPVSPGQQPYTQPGYGEPAGPYPTAGAPPGGGQNRNVGMLVGIGGGTAILLILLVIIGINLFGGDDGGGTEPPPPTPVETDDGTDEGTDDGGNDIDSDDPLDGSGEDPVETDSFVPGDTVSGTVPEGGEWTGTMTVAEDSVVILDVAREHSDLDPTLTVRDGSGSEIIFNDDRHGGLNFIVGSRFNPYVALTLEAGEYTVEVGSYRSRGEGDFRMGIIAPSTIEVGQEDTLDLSQDQYGGYAVNITEAGTYTFAASVDSGDAAIVLFDDSGVSDSNRGSGSASITVDLEPGLHPVLTAEELAGAVTLTFTVESN